MVTGRPARSGGTAIPNSRANSGLRPGFSREQEGRLCRRHFSATDRTRSFLQQQADAAQDNHRYARGAPGRRRAGADQDGDDHAHQFEFTHDPCGGRAHRETVQHLQGHGQTAQVLRGESARLPANAPWTFTATQTLDKMAAGLALKVQYAFDPAGPWNDFPDNVMAQTIGTTLDGDASAIPLTTEMYFQTVTSTSELFAAGRQAGGRLWSAPGTDPDLARKTMPPAGDKRQQLRGRRDRYAQR